MTKRTIAPETHLEPGELSIEEVGRSLNLYSITSQIEDLTERYEIEYEGIGDALEKLLEPLNEDDRYRGHFMDKEELALYLDEIRKHPGVGQAHR